MQEAIYKGATRPPILLGVPLIPAVLVGGASILLLAYLVIFSRSFLLAAVALAPIAALWSSMMLVTRKDDQRLMQTLLRFRLRQRRGSLRVWGAHSYAPGAVRGMTALVGKAGRRAG